MVLGDRPAERGDVGEPQVAGGVREAGEDRKCPGHGAATGSGTLVFTGLFTGLADHPQTMSHPFVMMDA